MLMGNSFLTKLLAACAVVLLAGLCFLAIPGKTVAEDKSGLDYVIPVDSSIEKLFVSVQPLTPTFDGKKIDPVYLELARSTGGSVVAMEKVESSTLFLNASMNTETVMEVDGKLKAGDIPLAFALYKPSGEELSLKQDGVEVSNSKNGGIISVKSPQAGNWKLHVSGSNPVSVRVTAKTNLFIVSARFVEIGGRLGHQGYFPKDDQTPYAGKKEMLEISIGNGNKQFSDLEFAFIGVDGKILQSLKSMKAQNSGKEYFMGEVIIPSEPYRIAMLGTDSSGVAFQRNLAPLSQPVKR